MGELQQLGLGADGTAGEEAAVGEAAGAASMDSSSSQLIGTEGAAAAAAGTTTSGRNSSSPWPDDMDQLLELALLQALSKSVKDSDLPLNSSALWAQHVTPSRPPGDAGRCAVLYSAMLVLFRGITAGKCKKVDFNQQQGTADN